MESFIYCILLELCVIYDTMNVDIFYIHGIICYMYDIVYVGNMHVRITFKCDYHINNICLGP